VSDLKFNSGEPSLNLVGSAYRNGPGGSKGQVGGLSAIGLELTAEQAAYLGGQKIGEVKGLKPWNFLVKPLGGERLSNKEEVVFQDSVPLKIKAN
jgi:hypothetical protein